MENIEQQKFNSIKMLADLNIKISEANDVLSKIETTTSEYLKTREIQGQEQIQKIVNESQELLEESIKNYKSIQHFCNVVNNYADILNDNLIKFNQTYLIFNERNEIWNKNIEKINNQISEQKKTIEIDKKDLIKQEEYIKEREERMKKEKLIIEGRHQELLKSIEIEKDLWKKIQS